MEVNNLMPLIGGLTSIVVVILVIFLASRITGNKNASASPWILKTFQIDSTGSTGAHLFIEARKPGFFAFILNLMGLDPTAELKVTKGSVSFRTTSLSGMIETSTALTEIGSFQGGYSKPIAFLFISGAMFLGSIYLDLVLGGSGFFILFGTLFSSVCLIMYALNKYLMFGFETSGGAYYGLTFKRGILNNVSVDIQQVELALQLVKALIGSITLGASYSVSNTVTKVAPQATITQSIAPQTPVLSSMPPPNLVPPQPVNQSGLQYANQGNLPPPPQMPPQ